MSTKKTTKTLNVPNLRFPGFSGEWEVKNLEELTTRIGDGLHGTPVYVEESNFYFINGNNLINGRISLNENTKKVDADTHFKNDKGLKANSILISLNGTIGSIARYKNENVMLGKSVGYLNFEIDSDFIFYKLQTKSIQEFFASEMTGSTIKNLSLKTLRETSIALPSTDEQAEVSKLLLIIEDRIYTQSKIIQQLESLMTSTTEKLLKQRIRFSRKEFGNWEKKKLQELCHEHQLKNIIREYNEVFSVAKHKGVINQVEHLGRSFSSSDIAHYKLVYPGDLVYTKSPTSDFPFGIIKQNRTGRIGVVSPLYCVFKPKSYALGYLIHEYFKSSINTFNYLNPLVQKGAKNTMNINNKDFLNGASLLFPVNENEQTIISNFLSSLEQKIETEKKILTAYETQKKYLLQNLFI